MIKATDSKPWYKQFWPWFVISLPATAVVAGLITVVIAVQNKTQDMHVYSVSFDGLNNAKLDVPPGIEAKAGDLVTVTAVITADPKDLTGRNMSINLKVVANDDPEIAATSESRFISPAPKQ